MTAEVGTARDTPASVCRSCDPSAVLPSVSVPGDVDIGVCASGAASGGKHAVSGLAAHSLVDAATHRATAAAAVAGVLVQVDCVGKGEEGKEGEEDGQKGGFEMHFELPMGKVGPC